jgi:anthranilate phosphoribosyltransferase
MPEYLNSALLLRLVNGAQLDRHEAQLALADILSGSVEPVLVASFVTALTTRNVTAEEMTGFVDAMMAVSTRVEVPEGAMDIVGTGGDLSHSVNVSTMAALTVAGAGVPVAKHGNRAASSSVGTADVLEGLGLVLEQSPETVRRSIDECNFGFCFAPVFHPALRHLAPIRRTLGFRTVFNFLGPLASPASVRRGLFGVSDETALDRMAHVLQSRGVIDALCVYSDDGLDEISVGAPSTWVRITHGDIRTERFDPASVKMSHSVADIRGGNLATNVRAVEEYLAGKEGPVADIVSVNAAAALMVAGRAESIVDGIELARESVRSGRAGEVLSHAVGVSRSAS